ncbi:FG-GAP repeat protein [Thalassoglobus neptunius]|uniref:FG-GAP repeat protein n=1 Tax=Thalassoglobus neptunius TaxID=1938619 RepID=A0A5C5X5M2_9PLAN|nr:FG-GAP-like repeat-containing protein [Thalassoglobus neptunius]TWT58407.1 FG-GAP repeat protein [Thalassoglobus neptunius]
MTINAFEMQTQMTSNRFYLLMRISLFLIGLFAIAVISVVMFTRTYSLDRAQQAFRNKDFPKAQRLTEQLLKASPENQIAQALLAASLFEQGRSQAALTQLSPGSESQTLPYLDVVRSEVLVKLGRLDEAQEILESLLERQQLNQSGGFLLLQIYQRQSRSFEAFQLARRLHQGRFINSKTLVSAVGLGEMTEDTRLVSMSIESQPDGQLVNRLSLAHDALQRSLPESALDLFRNVAADHPELGDAQGRIGQLVLELRPHEFPTWHAALPVACADHPEVWMARGLGCEAVGEIEQSRYCYTRVLSRQPRHLRATERLAELLGNYPNPGLVSEAEERARILRQLSGLLSEFQSRFDQQTVKAIQQSLRQLGDPLLAILWERAKPWSDEAVDWISLNPSVLLLKISSDPKGPFVESLRNSFVLQNEIDWLKTFAPLADLQGDQPQRPVEIRFENVAEEAGINLTYDNGSRSPNPLSHLVETTGGGVAVIDLDADGWPDLALAQGNDWRNSDLETQRVDRLFRNLGNGRFADVTSQTGLASAGYTQGITAADFNCDGLMDLYICTLRGNHLFENLGDGTFADVTELSQTAGDDWSISAGFGDLSGDGLPDLYVVNYLDRDSVLRGSCVSQGSPRACPPTAFAAAGDVFYLNLGDGRFRDVTNLAGFDGQDGKGMGLIIADIDESQSLDLFVANDTTPNFFYERAEITDSGIPKYQENGVLAGVATDGAGRTQSSMGIATGDVNGDEQLDLFVTNFYGESNTLYSQSSESGFADETSAFGLREQSLPVLGFGTQFLDADLDGDLDLFIANGHIDWSFATGEPDRMTAQFFENTGGGVFHRLSSETLGAYFQKPGFARAVATVDFNRDGLRDVAVTHIDDPFALLENRSTKLGNWFRIRLIGTRSDRNAVGTTIKAHFDEQTLTACVTSGDGYACSNEKTIQLGLSDAERIERLVVRWPGGLVQEFADVSGNQEWICVEGQPVLLSSDSGTTERPVE